MRILNIGLLLVTFAFFVTGCFNIPIGDGNKMKISKEGIKVTDEKGDEHSITIDQDEGQMKMTGFGMDEDDDEVTLGQNLDVPKSMPDDIPIPDDANIFQSSDVTESTLIAYEVDTDPNEVDQLYEQYFNSDVFTESPEIAEEQSEGTLLKVYQAPRKDGVVRVQINGYDDNNTKVIVGFSTNKND